MATVTSATSFFPTAKEGFTTTTSGAVSASATTVGLNSVAGYTNGETVVLVIEPTISSKKQAFTGTVDTAGIQITNVVWTEGNNVAHSAGVTVVDYETATHWALYSKGLKVGHNNNGTHKAFTEANIVDAVNIKASAVTPAKWTNPYKFSAYIGTSLTIAAATWTRVPYNTENFDTNGDYEATANYRYTAPVTGYYAINMQVQIGTSGISTTTNAVAALYKNGIILRHGQQAIGSGNTLTQLRPSVNGLFYLIGGDYIEGYAYCGEAGREVTAGPWTSWIDGYLVSQT